MRKILTKICLPLCLMAQPGITYAKGKVDTIFTRDGVDVYIRKNKGKKLKMIAELRLADLETGVTDPGRLSTGVNADYFLPRYASFTGNIKGTYYSVQQNFAEEKNRSKNVLVPHVGANIGARIHFLDRRGEVWKKVTLGVYDEFNEDGSPHTAIRYLRAKYPCRRILAVRAGLYYNNTPVSADMNGDLLRPSVPGELYTEDGTKFTGHYYTNSYTKGYYVGFNRIRNINIMVSSNVDTFEGKGRHIAFYRELYADVIFGDTRFDPLQVANKEYPIVPNAPGSFRTGALGFRVGGRAMSRRSPGTIGGFYEIGMRPGLYLRGAYACVGFTFCYIK
ncbi:hypothetical protein GCM10023093_13820 [Nemorincola caseinilytica]|uniref:Uncharacterized protein n=1 Tax=Nemorincola caseinilytica TaxID=2054315 RepID=A0ABP8NES5_9BACT